MLAVVSMFKTILQAEPAFRRVEPASTSGPVLKAMTTRAKPDGGFGLQVTSIVWAPRLLAVLRAERTKGVTPLAAIPTTTSLRRTPIRRTAETASFSESSEPSFD